MVDEERKVVDLNGTFRFKVDSKGRVSLPAKFRKALSDDLVITPDVNSEYLMVFEQPAFNSWVRKLFEDRYGHYNSGSRKHQLLRSQVKGRADEAHIDSAGRILISSEQRKVAGIDRDVVIIGNEGYFEIWDAKRHEEVSKEIDITELLTDL